MLEPPYDWLQVLRGVPYERDAWSDDILFPFNDAPPDLGVAYVGEFVDFEPPKLLEVLVDGRDELVDGVERVPPKAEEGFELYEDEEELVEGVEREPPKPDERV